MLTSGLLPPSPPIIWKKWECIKRGQRGVERGRLRQSRSPVRKALMSNTYPSWK